MCGLTGLFDSRAARPFDPALIQAMTDAVAHRGPDGEGVFIEPGVALGHRRLAFIDLAPDKRTYRFFQDTRHGRVLIAESQSADTIVAAVADYVARRLVERERALTADSRVAEEPRPQAAEASGPAAWPIARPRPRALLYPPAAASDPPPAAEHERVRPKRGIMRLLGDALSLFLMLLGSMTLALLLGIGGYWAWTARVRDLWAHWIGAPPF